MSTIESERDKQIPLRLFLGQYDKPISPEQERDLERYYDYQYCIQIGVQCRTSWMLAAMEYLIEHPGEIEIMWPEEEADDV